MKELMLSMAKRAKDCARVLATAPTDQKNKALTAAAKLIRERSDAILAANKADLDALPPETTPAMRDRLLLTPERVAAMAKGVDEIAALPDPVGRVLAEWTRPNGLKISRVSVPLGVIGVIYESRPNVTADAGALCFKSGNAVILRGGSEAFRSSSEIAKLMRAGLKQAGLPEDCVQFVPTTDRAAVGELLKLDEYVDVIVPRGGESLIRRITNESKIPLFKHLNGICHTYIHRAADADKARKVVLNAKMRRTGTCNSTETILCDKAVSKTVLPAVVGDLIQAGCEVRGDEAAQSLDPRVKPATAEDWDTEYLAPIVSVKVVENIDEAINHIARHGSHHTESILTEDAAAAEKFLNEVDSAVVIVNASTQFCDGGEFGMGAEIGIATGRLHARGPVGLEQLTTFKYQVRGDGQTRP
ncbi:MAG TPA: glutamate-5-semialdehyde dehydrogenase [Alphaproteobacteria bacterium]|nr:glutamate-5-semialdehyde dehydrogenase [Alphaproteobacteria bacterium]